LFLSVQDFTTDITHVVIKVVRNCGRGNKLAFGQLTFAIVDL